MYFLVSTNFFVSQQVRPMITSDHDRSDSDPSNQDYLRHDCADQDSPSISTTLGYPSLSSEYEAFIVNDRVACAVEATLQVISGRWKVLIFRELLQGTKRFNELQRAVQGITHKMLIQQLRDMEADGIVQRDVYQQLPAKVEYSLTPLGKTLNPIINAMHQWGVEYLQLGINNDS